MLKKLLGPIITLLIFTLYFIGIIILFCFIGIPLIAKILLIIFPLASFICLLFAFIQRAKEIKGGHEDDISNY